MPFLVIWITHGIGGFGITFILPTIIYELGISDTAVSQLMTMPAYSAVFVILLTAAWLTHSDRLSPWIAGLILEVVQIVCYVLLITVRNAVAKYIFVCIATAATSSFFPIIWPGECGAPHGYSRILHESLCSPRDDPKIKATVGALTPMTERIRATRGTTNAGLAIGMTNVSATTERSEVGQTGSR